MAEHVQVQIMALLCVNVPTISLDLSAEDTSTMVMLCPLMGARQTHVKIKENVSLPIYWVHSFVFAITDTMGSIVKNSTQNQVMQALPTSGS